jgi:diguanylate cyclase (GGDEF)-like protein
MPRPRWWCGAIGVAGLLGLGLRVAPAEEARPSAGWLDRGDIVLRPVAQAADQPTVLLPLAIEQDARGFLWAAGEAGLLRWDGYRFHAYAANHVPPDGLGNHYVQCLHRDAAGRLWVGTVEGELARYDPGGDRFDVIALDPAHGGAQSIWALDDDGSGGLWAATNRGLFHLDADGTVTGHLTHDGPGAAGRLPDDRIQALLRDRQGRLWIGGRFGLAHGNADNTRFAGQDIPLADGGTIEVSHLLQDSAGRIWVGTRHHGAYALAPGSAAARPVALPHQAGEGEAGVEIMAMAEVSPGRIWLGTFGQGIADVDAATGQTRQIRHDPFVPGSLNSDSVYALFPDRSGIVWVGTTLGISQYNPGDGGIATLFGDPGRRDGLTGHDITALLPLPDGTLWIASQTDGIQIMGPDGAVRGRLPVKRVFCLAADPQGPVFIGTRAGLYRSDALGQHLDRLQIPGRRVAGGVFSLHFDRGTLWLGGDDDGLWRLAVAADGRVTVLRHDDVPVLTDATVHAIAPGPDGRLAVGTENGFNLVDPDSGAVERVLHDAADPASIASGQVASFFVDRHGRLWAGSDNAGISIMLGRDRAGRPRFRHLGLADGLPNADINLMLPDRQGRIWVSTDNGLAAIDQETFAVRAFRAVDGVAIATFWGTSGAATPSGALLFGGTGGMAVVRPERVGSWQFRPPVVITDVTAGGRPHGVDGSVTVPPDANSLSVEFAALDFSSPDSLRYRHRLRGFETAWIPTDAAHRVAAYTNLPPGDFRFEVQGSNRNGVWSEQPATLAVRVLPAWFQTIWCRLAEAGAAALAVAALVQGRTIILRRRQRALERQVAERTAELSARTEELTASQAMLHRLAYFDPLTALPNRRALHEAVQALVQGQAPQPFALMLIDLDGFKQVNDTLGHAGGDTLLVVAAGRLREAVREGDLVARLGGDEFAILLRAVRDEDPVAWVADRLVAGMAEPMTVQGTQVRIGASAGAARFPEHGTTEEALYRHADLALYDAKRAGRGVWRWYREEGGRAAEATSP